MRTPCRVLNYEIPRNALRLLLRPRLACDYVQFLWGRLQFGCDVVRVLPEGLRIGGLSGFSEFHSCANFVNAAERRFLRDFPFDGWPILDVGANLGIFSLLLAKRLPENQIHAFEPNPSTFRAMLVNFMRNCCPNAQRPTDKPSRRMMERFLFTLIRSIAGRRTL